MGVALDAARAVLSEQPPATPTPGMPPETAAAPPPETPQQTAEPPESLEEPPGSAEAPPPEGEQPPEQAAPPEPEGPPESLEEPEEDAEPLTAEEQARIDKAIALDPADPKRDEAIRGAYQATARGRNIYNAAKGIRDVLGRWPTEQDLQAIRDQLNGQTWMSEHIAHGTPQEREGVWEHLIVDRESGKPYEGTADFVGRLPDVLLRVDPQAYSHLENRIAGNIIELAYGKAAQLPEGNDRANWLAIAQNLDFRLTGKFRTLEAAAAPANGHANGAAIPPEVQQRLDQAERERDELRRRDVERFVGGYRQETENALQQAIDNVVFTKWKLPTEADRKAHRFAMADETRRVIQTSPAIQASKLYQDYELARRNAFRTGSPQARDAAVQLYRQLVEKALKAHVWPDYRKGLTPPSADTRAESERRHEVQKAAQQHTAPGAGGSPVPAAAASAVERPRGMSDMDYALMVAKQEMSVAAG